MLTQCYVDHLGTTWELLTLWNWWELLPYNNTTLLLQNISGFGKPWICVTTGRSHSSLAYAQAWINLSPGLHMTQDIFVIHPNSIHHTTSYYMCILILYLGIHYNNSQKLTNHLPSFASSNTVQLHLTSSTLWLLLLPQNQIWSSPPALPLLGLQVWLVWALLRLTSVLHFPYPTLF